MSPVWPQPRSAPASGLGSNRLAPLRSTAWTARPLQSWAHSGRSPIAHAAPKQTGKPQARGPWPTSSPGRRRRSRPGRHPGRPAPPPHPWRRGLSRMSPSGSTASPYQHRASEVARPTSRSDQCPPPPRCPRRASTAGRERKARRDPGGPNGCRGEPTRPPTALRTARSSPPPHRLRIGKSAASRPRRSSTAPHLSTRTGLAGGSRGQRETSGRQARPGRKRANRWSMAALRRNPARPEYRWASRTKPGYRCAGRTKRALLLGPASGARPLPNSTRGLVNERLTQHQRFLRPHRPGPRPA
jgi:hypothetical protein